MQIDPLTLEDLSIIKGSDAVYHVLDKCHTKVGSLHLREKLSQPLGAIAAIKDYQESVVFWTKGEAKAFQWSLTNGTVMMLEQFLHNQEFAEKISNDWSLQLQTFLKKIINKESLTYVSFIAEQLTLLIQDAQKILHAYQAVPTLPALIEKDKQVLEAALNNDAIKAFLSMQSNTKVAARIVMVYNAKRYAKADLQRIVAVIAHTDVLRVAASWALTSEWSMPIIYPKESLMLSVDNLIHPLLEKAYPYAITFDKAHQFLMITGANMSGKSTFMRAIGVAVVLAHCGFPVPATSMHTSVLEALITQIQVQDDLSKGESYFYAEVLRMKQTALRIQQQSYNLVIMDELFKGTNVHDAYECSLAVIKGLQRKGNNLVLLSTHLHELAGQLEDDTGIFFKYFETIISADKHFQFTYKMKDGVSKDRIGYALLIQEGVIDLLK